MLKKYIISFLLLLVVGGFFLNSKVNKSIAKTILLNKYVDHVKSANNGYLKISKINLKEDLYDFNSKYNSLDYGLQVLNLNPLVIAGHSGYGTNALFNNLTKLNVDDNLFISYNYQNNNYKITNIYEKEKKDLLLLAGDLELVTCVKNTDKQIVIIGQKS